MQDKDSISNIRKNGEFVVKNMTQGSQETHLLSNPENFIQSLQLN